MAATLGTALVFKRKQKCFTPRVLLIEILLITFVGFGVLSWTDTQNNLRIIMTPFPVPNGLRVHHGRNTLFGGYVNFTGPPSVISALLHSKGLVEVSTNLPDSSDIGGFVEKATTTNSWDWWQPNTMPNPRFYYRHHDSNAAQGWSEGWWVNDATNEVYAFIGG
jgi:hypothetical protein